LLEIGFGDGPLTERIRGPVDDYWGIEPMPAAFEKAIERLKLDRTRFYCIRAEELDEHPTFATSVEAFDVIVQATS
jgi:hypothetical protein